MTTIHADSQITTGEAAELLVAALASPAHRSTYHLVDGRKFGTREMLGRFKVGTPEGELHRVAVVDVQDGEPMGFDQYYRAEVEAIAVWEHLASEYTASMSSGA